MRLSTIKLAGFKSFVDPTTLHLPTNMTLSLIHISEPTRRS